MEFPNASRDKKELEGEGPFTPGFGPDGLVTAVVTDARDDMLLMVAHMNAEALSLTLDTGIAHYWSRSRGKLWKKGEVSGNFQRVVEIRTDCDQDAIWLRVEVAGHDATCHTGRRSCFYRTVEVEGGQAYLKLDGSVPKFDTKATYGRSE